MANPIAMLDAEARALYEAWVASPAGRRAAWNPFSGSPIKPTHWDRLDNHAREVWRGKALGALRSEETLADELKREERERSLLRPSPQENDG